MNDAKTAPPTDNSDFSCSYSAGDTVFEEGQDGAEMFIIQAGEVEILKETDGDSRQLALLEEGDFFGALCVRVWLGGLGCLDIGFVQEFFHRVLRVIVRRGQRCRCCLVKGRDADARVLPRHFLNEELRPK